MWLQVQYVQSNGYEISKTIECQEEPKNINELDILEDGHMLLKAMYYEILNGQTVENLQLYQFRRRKQDARRIAKALRKETQEQIFESMCKLPYFSHTTMTGEDVPGRIYTYQGRQFVAKIQVELEEVKELDPENQSNCMRTAFPETFKNVSNIITYRFKETDNSDDESDVFDFQKRNDVSHK